MEPFSLKGALDLLSKIGKLQKELSEVEIKEAMMELRTKLLDAEERILAMREENLTLRQQLKTQSEQAADLANKVEVQGFLYDEVNDQANGLPYCPLCLVKEGKLYRLARRNDQYSRCLNCDKDHNAGADGSVNQHRPQKAAVVRTRRPRWDSY
ncbi:MAG: hypothetical protein AAF376_00075 [Pseudomonadota bacterium]